MVALRQNSANDGRCWIAGFMQSIDTTFGLASGTVATRPPAVCGSKINGNSSDSRPPLESARMARRSQFCGCGMRKYRSDAVQCTI